MNLIIPVIAIVGAVVAASLVFPLPKARRRLAGQIAAALGWLGVLGGAAGIYLGELTGIGVLMGTAGCAGLAVLPWGVEIPAVRTATAAFGAVIPLVAGVVGVVFGADIDGGSSGMVLLYAAHWGTLAAALVAALIAAVLASSQGWAESAERKSPGASVGLAIAALTFGAYVIGVMRGGPTSGGWAVPIASAGGPVGWHIPPTDQVPGGLWIGAAADVSWMGPLLITSAVVAVATAVAGRLQVGRRASALGWFVSAGASLAGAIGLLSVRGGVHLPDATAYRETAASMLSGLKDVSAVVDTGSFVTNGPLHVPPGGLAPIFALTAAGALLGVVAGIFALRSSWPGPAGGPAGRTTMGLYARDYVLRSVVLGWLSWLLVTLIHWLHVGAVAVGSPAEWSAVGLLTIATGLAALSWSRRDSSMDALMRQAAPGVIFGLLVVGVSLGLVFDAPFGLSIVF